jgi:NB-ARC domain
VTDRPAPDETPQTVTANGDRGVGVGRDVIGSNIFTDDIKIEAPVTTVLHQLRAPVGDFVGRESEINTLINALRRESRACITGISGMGGIGKTELALLVAERLRDDYPDAQFFINLQGTDANPRSPQDVMATCIRAFLGPEAKLPEEPEQLSHLYRSQLSGKRVLLLLDNAADSAQVRPLLPPTGCAVLVTSRQSVALPGMTPLTLHPLTEKEARLLLLEIAARAEPAAEQICKLGGYLPLALRAAGSLLAITANLNPVDYAAQLQMSAADSNASARKVSRSTLRPPLTSAMRG